MRNARVFLTVLCLVFMSAGVPAAEPMGDPSGYLHVLEKGIVTPHRIIAQQYAKGGLKALCIVPFKLGAREVLEVAERFPFEFEVVTAASHDNIDFSTVHHFSETAQGMGGSLKEKREELKLKLKADYDLIAIGNFQWETLPDDVVSLILQKVENGTGLVVTYDPVIPAPGDGLIVSDFANQQDDYILKETPLAHLDAFRTRKAEEIAGLVRCYKLGKGRILFLRIGKPFAYNGGHAFTPMDEPSCFDRWANNYEYYISFFLKSALFAARKEPDVLFDKPEINVSTGAARLPVSIKGDAAFPLEWTLVVRDAEGRQESTASGKLASKEDRVIEYKLPLLTIGTHFLDVTLVHGRQVVNWAGFGFAVAGDSPIRELALARERFAPGEVVTGKLVFTQRPETCVVELVDNWGRIVARQSDADLRKNGESFVLEPGNNPSLRYRVRALAVNPNQKAESTKSFFVSDNGRGRFQSLYWGSYPPCYLGALAARRLYDAGWHVRFGGAGWMSNAYTVTEPACLFEFEQFDADAKVAEMKASVRQKMKETAGAPAFAYFLGDETIIGRTLDSGINSPALAKFPAYVESLYGNIASLNQRWGTKYTTFAEVKPSCLSDAVAAGAPGRWVVFRKFLSEEFFKVHLAARDTIRESDPSAPTGIEGTYQIEPGQWYNPLSLYRDLGLWGPYPDWLCSMVLKSTRDPSKPYGYWFGGYRDRYSGGTYYGRTAGEYVYYPWKHMMDGANSLWWFSEGGIEGMLDLNLDFTPYYKAYKDDVELVTYSLGPALMGARAQLDSVAVIYSPSSVIAAAAVLRNQDVYQTLGVDLVHTMQGCGIQPAIVDEQDAATGKADLRQYKVIVLPYNTAMSDALIGKLSEAVENGGTLVGSMDVGFMNENGDYRTQSHLNEIFGVTRDINPACPSKKTPLKWQGDLWGTNVQLNIPEAVVGESIKLTTGKAVIATGPVFIANRIGKGEAILLNCVLGVGDPRKPDSTAAVTVWKALFRHAGVQPPVSFAKEPGDRSLIELSTFQSGDVLIVGLQKNKHWDLDKECRLKVALGQAYTVRNLLTGENLGERDHLDPTLRGLRGAFFAMFPKPELDPEISLEPVSVKPGQTLHVMIRSQQQNAFPDRYSVRVYRVGDAATADSNHGVCSFWTSAAVKTGPECSMAVPVAYNDAPGQYRLVLRRDMTGVEKEFTFVIAP